MQTYKFEVHRTRIQVAEGRAHPIRSSADVARLVRGILGPIDREVLLALHLDAKHRLRGFVEVARGGISSAMCEPMQVFRAAVMLGCNSLVLSHNHPSGDPTPSAEDIALTKKLVQGARLLGMAILDHVIVTDDGHYSLLDSGQMPRAT